MTTHAQTSLTGEQIDRLSGVELGIAVAEAAGWKRVRPGVNSPDRLFGDDHEGDRSSLPSYHTDQGAALGLLLSLDVSECGWGITYSSDGFEVYSELQGEAVAKGSVKDAASVICRAYLKLVNQKES